MPLPSESPSPSGLRPPKIGLALGGGVARGWAHIGVLRALSRAGIEPDIVCGTSIGALVGGCYLAGHLDTLEDWARGLTKRRLMGYLDFFTTGSGLLGGRKLARMMDAYLADVRIEELSRPFVAVTGELATGHEVWIDEGPLVEAIQASYALPGVFSPMMKNDRLLIDGALVNPVPVSVCRAKGARLVIAVTLNADSFGKGTLIETDAALEVDLHRLHPAAGAETPEMDGKKRLRRRRDVASRLMMRQLFGREQSAPGIATVMLGALNIIMDRLARSRMAGDPPDILVCPRTGHISLLGFDRAEELIRLGDEALTRELPAIREAMTVLH
ncbi:MAG: patatin-like phospholipase family protein [Alphaproteobacteria bacterium]